MNMITLTLCLLIVISVSQVHGFYGIYGGYGGYGGRYGGYGPGPMYNPMARLKRICPYYNYEKIDEGYGFCNWKVLKEVYEKDRDWSRDRYMLTLFRLARDEKLCSSDGTNVIRIRYPCGAFEHICTFGRTVDLCDRIRQAQPPAGPPNTPRPNTPRGPPGGGI